MLKQVGSFLVSQRRKVLMQEIAEIEDDLRWKRAELRSLDNNSETEKANGRQA